MKIKLFICTVIIALFLNSGCDMCETFGWFCDDNITENPELKTVEDINNAQKIITTSSKTIKETSDNIAKETGKIDKETTEVEKKIPEEIKPGINPHLSSIKESSDTIKKDTEEINKATKDLDSANILLKTAEQKTKTTESALDKVIKERDKALIEKEEAINAKNEGLHKMLRWLIVGCIIGVGVFGVLFLMYGSRFGIVGAAACALILSVSIFVEVYAIYLAICGGCLFFGLVGVLIWNVIVQKRAFRETVETVEIAQDSLTDEARKKIFGGVGETGIMDGIQNKNTMLKVQKEKRKMSNLWYYAKVNKTNETTPTDVIKKRTYIKKKKKKKRKKII